jgi:polyisoprenoid-binding protein YceI
MMHRGFRKGPGRFSFGSKELVAAWVAKQKFNLGRKKESLMFRNFTQFGLVALAGLFSVAPVLAQSSVSQIDAEHSTARLYLASTKNPSDNLNVGVARTSGVINLSADSSATPDFDFTIYPADKKQSPSDLAAKRRKDNRDYTVIAFKSRSVEPLNADTYRVTGNLTVTYVEREASYDPTEAYSGPTYGPAVTVSQTQPASFEFRRATPSGASARSEWIASSTISGEDFPDLLNAVSSTDWPVFVADEHCTMPSNAGQEDYSGQTCTGERVDVAERHDLSCDTPSMVGEDFSGEVCTQIAPAVIAPDKEQSFSAERRNDNSNSNLLVANEVQIKLDLLTTDSTSNNVAAISK